MEKIVTIIEPSIECPCNREKISEPEKLLLNQAGENLIFRVDPIGTFYKSQNHTGRLSFCDIFFEENPEYNGFLKVKSPLKIFFEITRICNLKCRGCYIPDMDNTEMTLNQAKGIIDKAHDAGVMTMQVLGGEPTLHKECIEICKYIKSKGITVEMVSNGTGITSDFIKNIKGNIDYIAISVDGNEENHDKYRGKIGSFKKAIEAYNLLFENGIPTEILMTVNKLNMGDIDELYALKKGGNDQVFLKLLQVSKGMSDSLKDIALDKEDIVKIYEKVQKLGISMQASFLDLGKGIVKPFYGCPGGIITCIVDTVGDIYKCLYDRTTPLGNIFQEKFQDIWERVHDDIQRIQGEKCNNCIHRSVCGGFCDIGNVDSRF